jgi:hypothetical protein
MIDQFRIQAMVVALQGDLYLILTRLVKTLNEYN